MPRGLPELRLKNHFSGEGLRSRVIRGTAISLAGTGGQQLLRLLSNLILTRLLFPEAFGLMALIQTFIVGLQMFSDIGVRPSIIQNKRGEDPDFLNTAWTVQIIRGVVLWLVSCALAWPLSVFYDEPQILGLMPVVGLSALIAGFSTTKTAVANRKFKLGRQTVIGLCTQALGIVVMIGLAWIWPSVWALVIGSLISGLAGVLAGHRFMEGIPNRLRWDSSAARDLLSFGRFIFVSTLAGFFINQGDKLFLGKFVSLGDLGVYNIAFFMAGFPGTLGGMIAARILFPLYREIRPSQNAGNRAKIRRARNLLTGSLVLMFGGLALIGVPLIDLLYDDRYAGAGSMLIIMALMQIPNALVMGNNQLLLAEGDSRRFSHLVVVRGIAYFLMLFLSFWLLGLLGVLLTKGLVIVLTYPMQQRFLARYKGTDIPRDALFALFGIGVAVLAVWINWTSVSEFCAASRAMAPAVTGTWLPVSIFH